MVMEVDSLFYLCMWYYRKALAAAHLPTIKKFITLPLAFQEHIYNRVLVVQLMSLEHVSWPRRNVTATPKLAAHILEIHTKLTDLIELRDAAAARALMDDHVKMIRARRITEHGHASKEQSCC